VIHWLSPGDPARRTGGFLYNARMVAGLRDRGHGVRVHRLDAAWPLPPEPPAPPDLPRGATVVADGLLLTAMAPALSARPDLRVVALVHSPLWREGGGAALRAAEARALRACARIVATSEATAAEVAADTGRPVAVVVPGTDPAPAAPAGPGHRLLCPAHLIPRKGHLDLLAACAALPPVPWQLTLAGSPDADPAHAAAVARAAGVLGGRVRLAGALDAAGMAAAYDRADLVVLPSHYEAFGMVLTEAVARGIPVLTAPAGATPLLGDAARVVPAGDAAAWTGALAAWLGDGGLRARARVAARIAAAALPRWPAQVLRFEQALTPVTPRP
jgi:glycosyltransferase involved in cell wall biosynthesis